MKKHFGQPYHEFDQLYDIDPVLLDLMTDKVLSYKPKPKNPAGKVKGAAKTKASSKNGRKGGRPKKVVDKAAQ